MESKEKEVKEAIDPTIEKEVTVISKELRTMIPAATHHALQEFAKRITQTGLGKWDYGVAIKILLERSQIFELIGIAFRKIAELETRLAKFEGKPEEKSILTFGKKIKKKKEEKKNVVAK